jgi:hypothetical protein
LQQLRELATKGDKRRQMRQMRQISMFFPMFSWEYTVFAEPFLGQKATNATNATNATTANAATNLRTFFAINATNGDEWRQKAANADTWRQQKQMATIFLHFSPSPGTNATKGDKCDKFANKGYYLYYCLRPNLRTYV